MWPLEDIPIFLEKLFCTILCAKNFWITLQMEVQSVLSRVTSYLEMSFLCRFSNFAPFWMRCAAQQTASARLPKARWQTEFHTDARLY